MKTTFHNFSKKERTNKHPNSHGEITNNANNFIVYSLFVKTSRKTTRKTIKASKVELGPEKIWSMNLFETKLTADTYEQSRFVYGKITY